MPDTHKVVGSTKQSGVAEALTVDAFDAVSGVLRGTTTADGAGDYVLGLTSGDDVYVLCEPLSTGTQHLPEIDGPITPDAI